MTVGSWFHPIFSNRATYVPCFTLVGFYPSQKHSGVAGTSMWVKLELVRSARGIVIDVPNSDRGICD